MFMLPLNLTEEVMEIRSSAPCWQFI